MMIVNYYAVVYACSLLRFVEKSSIVLIKLSIWYTNNVSIAAVKESNK